jgi:hypothetical protein
MFHLKKRILNLSQGQGFAQINSKSLNIIKSLVKIIFVNCISPYF